MVIARAAAVASAQSLGQAAQNEKKKRETPAVAGKTSAGKPKEKKVYTGEDLDSYWASRPDEGGEGAKSADAPAPARPEAPSSTSPRSGGRSPMGISDDSEERVAQERSWRVWAEKANESEARLARARTALEAAKKNLEQFEEEARRAGIPAGWIR